MSVIRVADLSKNYGSVQALDGVSLTVDRGEVFGLLGPNGAGKSTLIKILLGIVRKSDGHAELLGQPAGPAKIRKRVGYLPEDHQFPGYHSGYSLLDFYGQLYGLTHSERKAKIPSVLEVVGIAKRMHSKIKTYSKGMKQRLGIASAILHEPDVIFLDEPTDGVDPVGRKDIRELMERLKGEGKTVFVNSHLLGEVELVCDRVAILQRGEVARAGTVGELTRQEGSYIIGLADGGAFPTEAVEKLGMKVQSANGRHEVLVGADLTQIDKVLSLLSEKGLKLRHLMEKKQTLEDVFISMVDQAEPGTERRRPAKARRAVVTKFFAMLKDSFREAIDGWIFYMMLILIGILVVLVFSISVEPLPANQGVAKIVDGSSLRIVSPDRGQSKKLFIMTYSIALKDVQVTNDSPDRPWESGQSFILEFSGVVGAPAAIEVDNAKKPTSAKPVDGGGIFSDTFKEAVRIWASTDDGKTRPKYSEELGAEFVEFQLKNAASLKVTKVERLGGGKYRVHADGVVGRKAWPHHLNLFFGAWNRALEGQPLGSLVYFIEDILLNTFGAWILMLAGAIVTAGFIPNMMRKGAIDLLLTKPMSRTQILIFKYFGGLLFVFLLTVLAVGGVWLAVGARTGIWSPGLLYCAFGITFYFAILYACSTLFGVLTRNAIVCIVVTIVFWFTVWLIGYLFSTFTLLNNMANIKPGHNDEPAAVEKDDDEKIPAGVINVFDVLNTLTPRTKDLDKLTTRLIGEGLLSPADQKQGAAAMKDVRWGEVIAVAGAWIVLFLVLALLRFATRSY